jgi:Ca-activated chloride channel family protein
MYRLVLLLALALLPVASASAQGSPPNSEITQVDTSKYPDISLYVSVTDAQGAPVAGIGQNEFAITEDNQPVTIKSFEGGGAGPINSALVIDRSGSMEEADKLDGAQDAAQAFVEQMRSGDQTTVIAFNSDVQTPQIFTNDTETLARSIERLRADGGTALYDSIIAGVDALKGVEGRRALFVLTDGQDCREANSCPDSEGSDATLEEAINYAAQNGQPVYVIGLGDRDGEENEGIDESVLQRIAEGTGGEYFYTPRADELASLYTRLAGNLQEEYRITYESPRPFYDGTRRDIQVSVGGAPAIDSGYVEQHMIYVRSNPIVALILLMPILIALFVPLILQRGAKRKQPAAASAAPLTPTHTTTATSDTIISHPATITVLPPDVPHCSSCDAALTSPDAKFCSMCGAVQSQAAQTVQERCVFCDQCGRPLRPGARFCPSCGTAAVVPELMEQQQ